jgi:hypothetical protein
MAKCHRLSHQQLHLPPSTLIWIAGYNWRMSRTAPNGTTTLAKKYTNATTWSYESSGSSESSASIRMTLPLLEGTTIFDSTVDVKWSYGSSGSSIFSIRLMLPLCQRYSSVLV